MIINFNSNHSFSKLDLWFCVFCAWWFPSGLRVFACFFVVCSVAESESWLFFLCCSLLHFVCCVVYCVTKYACFRSKKFPSQLPIHTRTPSTRQCTVTLMSGSQLTSLFMERREKRNLRIRSWPNTLNVSVNCSMKICYIIFSFLS